MKKSFLAITVAIVVGFLSAVTLCVRALGAQEVSAFESGGMRVVVDAGHGGIDGGVSGEKTGVRESDLNLALAMELKERLEDAGFEVTLTRKTEAGLYGTTAKGFKKRDMQKRREIIEEANPDLVISLHQNFYPSKTTRGGQVFYKRGAEEGKRLANCVQEKLNALYATEGAKGRKSTPAEYFILQCALCPSVIVECGFLSNEKDEELLRQSAWQERIAESITAGVLVFLSENVA